MSCLHDFCSANRLFWELGRTNYFENRTMSDQMGTLEDRISICLANCIAIGKWQYSRDVIDVVLGIGLGLGLRLEI